MKIYYVNVSLREADSEDEDAELNAVEIDNETTRVSDNQDDAYTEYRDAIYVLQEKK